MFDDEVITTPIN